MREPNIDRQVSSPWHVPVALEDVPETGQHIDLAADADVRAAVARMAGVRELQRFEANFDLTRQGASSLHVVGRISATVGQNCVVTLEPLVNEVDEEVDLLFAPPRPAAESAGQDVEGARAAAQQAEPAWDEPEPLIGGVVDLGALATEFLILGIDPYPRKPGAVFQPPQDVSPDGGPFAALAKLTKGRDGD